MSFTITGVRETGTITYHCSTTSYAWEKFQDFQKAEYSDIKIVTSDDLCISESKLAAMIDMNCSQPF